MIYCFNYKFASSSLDNFFFFFFFLKGASIVHINLVSRSLHVCGQGECVYVCLHLWLNEVHVCTQHKIVLSLFLHGAPACASFMLVDGGR